MRSGGKTSAERTLFHRSVQVGVVAALTLVLMVAALLPGVGLTSAAEAEQSSTRVATRRPAAAPSAGPTNRQRVIVDFDRSVERSMIRQTIADLALHRAEFHRLVPHQPTAAVTLEPSDIRRLRADRRVLSVKVDGLARPAQVAEIAEVVSGAQTVGAPNLWAGGRTGEGAVVAVIDTGVDANHPFLAGKVIAEACFSSVDGTDVSTDRVSLCPNGERSESGSGAASPTIPACLNDAGENLCGHGTHVAGIIAGSDPATGATGVAPDADIVAVQVFHRMGDDLIAYTSDIVAALAWLDAFDGEVQGRRLAAVNLSLGGGRYFGDCDNDARKPMIDALAADGVITTVASGNRGWTDSVQAPACVSSAVAVAASDAGDRPAFYSNVSASVDVFAPGSNVVSAIPGGGFEARWGTSAAAPHVAGAAALVSTKTRTLSETRTLIGSSATYLCGGSACRPRLSLAAAFNGSPGLQVSVAYSSSELEAIDQAATRLGRSPEELQRIGAGLFAFLVATDGAAEPLTTTPALGRDGTLTSVLTFAEVAALDRLARTWGVQRDVAAKVATQLIVYLLATSR